MLTRTKTSPPRSMCFEPLEDRVLLAWGAYPHLINQDAAFAKYPTINGAGESIVVIDSGVDYKHPQLGGTFGQPDSKVIAGWDFTTNTPDPMDDYGHGTGVAGLLAANQYNYKNRTYQGIAPAAKLIALRCKSQSPDVPYDATDYEKALQWVIANRDKYNIVAVNITDFGGGGYYTSPHTQQPYSDELATLDNMGVFVGSPAGNEPINQETGIKYPAADPHVVATGASNATDTMFIYSQRGPLIDMVAPGDHVICPYYDPKLGNHLIIDYADGTSFASPQVVGTAALIKQINPNFTNAQVLSILQESGVNVVDDMTTYTYKRLNVLGALDLAFARTVRGTIGPDIPGGMDNSIAFDGNGRLHMAYFDPGTGLLHYVSRTPGGVWGLPATVGNVVGAGSYCNIAIDGAGMPAIAYYNPQTADLMYAQPNSQGTGWDTITVDSNRTTGLYPSMKFDAADDPVITYYNKTYGDLKMAAFNGFTWTISTLDSTGDVGRYSSLASNPSTGRWAVSYLDYTNSGFKFGQNTKRGWAFSTVDVTGGGGGGYTSLAFDKSNNPAFSYYNAYSADLKFAHFNGTKWSVQTVASKNTQGLYTNLSFNHTSGLAQIAFCNRSAQTVGLATGDIGSWTLSTAASGGGSYTSAARRIDGGLTVSYLGSDTAALHVVDL